MGHIELREEIRFWRENSSAGEVGHGPWGSMAGLPWVVSSRPGRDPDSKSKVRNHMNRHVYLHTHRCTAHTHMYKIQEPDMVVHQDTYKI